MLVRVGLAVLALQTMAAAAEPLTAKQVIERIQQHVGVAWRSETVDTIKSGDPNVPVTGIATTMMATLDVLKRASAAGKNLVITHEPTFYSHLDQVEQFQKENDPVWREKEAFIRDHHMVVWRFHDHWHMHRPDGILTGVVRQLQWQSYQGKQDPSYFVLPEMTLRQLALQMEHRLGAKVVRVIGDPQMKVTQVALRPGAGGFGSHRPALQRDDVQVLAIGEVPEWETIEYVADAVNEGRKKALILLGHIPSEQPGMEDCAGWLKGFVSEVPIEFIAAKEPFWTPSSH